MTTPFCMQVGRVLSPTDTTPGSSVQVGHLSPLVTPFSKGLGIFVLYYTGVIVVIETVIP